MPPPIWFAGFLLLSTTVILPFVALFPTEVGAPGHAYDITVALFSVVAAFDSVTLFLTIRLHKKSRDRQLMHMAWLAGVSVLAGILLKFDVVVPVIAIPQPHLLAPILGVDGESAYNADVFEIYCELWLLVALFFGFIALIVRGRQKYMSRV